MIIINCNMQGQNVVQCDTSELVIQYIVLVLRNFVVDGLVQQGQLGHHIIVACGALLKCNALVVY